MLRRYNASAGSGKTYTLVREYLTLVVRQPQRARRILAITFTNDATNELRSRVLQHLFALAYPDLHPGETSLRQAIRHTEPDLDDEQITQNARLALGLALHRGDTISIQTIDSFFQRMLRSFGSELGLGFNYRVELSIEQNLREAVDRLLDRVGRPGEEDLTNWLIEYAHEILDEKTRVGLRKKLRQQGRQLLNQLPASWSNRNAPTGQFLRAFLDERRSAFAQACQQAAAAFVQLMDEYSIELDFFKSGAKKTPVRFYPQILDSKDDFFSFLEKNYSFLIKEKLHHLLELDAEESDWLSLSKKTARDRQQQEQVRAFLAAGGLKLHRAFVRTFEQGYPRYATAALLRQQLYLLGVLGELLAELQTSLDRQRRLLIANVPRHLAEVINDYDPPFIYEKMGTRYGHFLIDEFQDTSSEQWKILRHLVLEGLSSGNRSFVVGDPKQAIYGWRGGQVDLFVHQLRQDVLPEQFEAQTLDENWRSWPRVVQFNNALFCALPDALHEVLTQQVAARAESSNGLPEAVAERIAADNRELMADLCEIYSPEGIVQQPRRVDAGLGYVRCEFVPNEAKPESKPDDENEPESDEEHAGWRELALARTLETVRRCLAEGYTPADIALLVRENRHVAQLSQRLRSELGIPVAARLLQTVQSSPLVRVLVNFLRWLNRPHDRLALVAATHDYHRYILEKPFPWEAACSMSHATTDGPSFAARLLATLPPAVAERVYALEQLDLYEQTEELIQLLDLRPRCDAFVLFLLEQMHTYIHREGNDAVGFLEWWAETGSQESIPSGKTTALRVLTIHQAKGLEFPVIILPFAEWEIEPTSDARSGILWVASQGTEWSELGPVLPLPAQEKLLGTDFAGQWLAHRRSNLIEQINLLYVALTRAQQRLYLFAPQAQYTKTGGLVRNCRGISAVLRELLAAPLPLQGSEPNGPHLLPTHWRKLPEGLGMEYGIAEPPPPVPQAQVPAGEPLHYESQPWRKRLVIRPRAADWAELNSHNWAGIRRLNWGSLVHEVLASIHHADDAPPRLAAALDRLERSGQLSPAERERLQAELDALLALPQFQEWLGPQWKIRTEAVILDPSGQFHQPDRVLTAADGRAVVIDFKTGQADASHSQQVRRYCQQVLAMGYRPVEGWLVYLGSEPRLVRVEGH